MKKQEDECDLGKDQDDSEDEHGFVKTIGS
jgi:hypothetical protein